MPAFHPAIINQHLQAITNSRLFQGTVIFIIVLSALTVGAKTYDLPRFLGLLIAVLDNAITLFFLIELLLRFAACPQKTRFLLNGWNLFDSIIVLGSLVPIENADTVLIGRLLRVFRVLRLVSVVPQLRFLINALLRSIPRMGYIALLMFVIFYIYGAIGAIFFADINQALWGDIAISMLTLFRIATLEDWTDVMYETMATYPFSWVFYLTFIFLTAFVFLNMMVGTILEIMTEEDNDRVNQQARNERQALAGKLDRIEAQLAQLTEQVERKHG